MNNPLSIDRTTGLRTPQSCRPFPVGPSTIEEVIEGLEGPRPRMIRGEESWTGDWLRNRVKGVSGSLVDQGISAGDRVLWQLQDGPESVVSLLATVSIGGIWVGLHPRASRPEARHVTDDSCPRLVLDALPDSASSPAPTAAALSPQRPAVIAYTSGTTGAAKGVVHTAQQILYPAAAAIAVDQLDSRARIATPLPLSTLNVLLLGPLTALACGGTAVVLERGDAHGLAKQLAEHSVTRLIAVPTTIRDMVKDQALLEGLDTLEQVVVGGAGITETDADAARSRGLPLIASYGLTEAPTGVARTLGDGLSGQLLPGVRLRVDETGELLVSSETEGEWAKTWQGALGYWRQPESTTSLWRDGWLHTGDTANLDLNNYLTVHGRISDMINRGGSTIAPAEVEQALAAIGFRESAVFALPDDRLGETVAAAIVTAEPFDSASIEDSLSDHLSSHKIPRRWLGLSELPRNRNGKIDRHRLQTLMETDKP